MYLDRICLITYLRNSTYVLLQTDTDKTTDYITWQLQFCSTANGSNEHRLHVRNKQFSCRMKLTIRV